MTTASTDVTRTYATVITAIETVDRDGQLRDRPVLCTAVIPKHSKMYGLRLSVEAAQIQNYKAGDQVTITIQRGKERKSPPQYPSDWFWNLSEIVKGHAQAPAAPPVANTDPWPGSLADLKTAAALSNETQPWENPPTQYRRDSGQDALQTRIAWNSAVNNAVHGLSAKYLSSDLPFQYDAIVEQATMIYDIITAGPPASVPALPPSEAADELKAPDPSPTPPFDPEAAVRDCLRRWNGDVKGGYVAGKIVNPPDISLRVSNKYGCSVAYMEPDQCEEVCTAIADGSILGWATQ